MAGPFTFHINVPFENGAILAELSGEVEVKPRYALAIRFDHGCASVAGKEVIDTLRSIEKEVRKIVAGLLAIHG